MSKSFFDFDDTTVQIDNLKGNDSLDVEVVFSRTPQTREDLDSILEILIRHGQKMQGKI